MSRKGYKIKRSFTSIKSKNIFNRLIFVIVRHFLPSKIAWSKNRLILDNLHQPRPSVVSVGKSVTIESKCHSKISSNTFLVKNICRVRFKIRILKYKIHLNGTFYNILKIFAPQDCRQKSMIRIWIDFIFSIFK